MQDEKRFHPRFDTIGRVEAEEICAFPGTLQNISASGCKIRFPIHVSVDLDKEYELKIMFSQNKTTKEMLLIGQPVYQLGQETSELGFKFLRSPGTRMLDSFIQSCKSLDNFGSLEKGSYEIEQDL